MGLAIKRIKNVLENSPAVYCLVETTILSLHITDTVQAILNLLQNNKQDRILNS